MNAISEMNRTNARRHCLRRCRTGCRKRIDANRKQEAGASRKIRRPMTVIAAKTGSVAAVKKSLNVSSWSTAVQASTTKAAKPKNASPFSGPAPGKSPKLPPLAR